MKHRNHQNPQYSLFEALEYKDMVGMMKPTIHVDEFASKMGDDDDVIVISFFVRSKQAVRITSNLIGVKKCDRLSHLPRGSVRRLLVKKSDVLEVVLSAPPERHAAIVAAARGSERPRVGTVREAADLLGTSVRTVQRLEARGLVHPVRISPRLLRYDLRAVEQLLLGGGQALAS
jgi:hypothetical protein